MGRTIPMTLLLILTAALWAFGPVGRSYAGPLQKGQVKLAADEHVTREVDIYRSDAFPSFRSKMIDLCQNLETDYNSPPGTGETTVKITKKETGPGMTEYKSEYRESNRFAGARDEARTIELCDRLQDSVPMHDQMNSEVHIYKKTTIKK